MTTGRLSPGVSTREDDRTLSIAPTFLRQGAFVGNFVWGPVDDPVLINDESNLIEKFLLPTDDNYKDWFTASLYLNESRGLRINRIAADDAYNAISGGSGTGLTVDTSVINGEVSSVAINAAGTGYAAGDIVEIQNGKTPAEIRILTINGVGAVLSFQLLSNGTGYVTSVDETTQSRKNFQIRNDDDFELRTAELPEILAKFPGSYGNNLGFSVMRASEFYGSQFEDRFRIQPTATNSFITGDGETATFTVGTEVVTDAERVITINNVEIFEGTLPGTYSVAGDEITINGDSQTFSGDNQTSKFTITNSSELDLFTSVVKVDGTTLTPSFNGTGQVPSGFFDINPETGELTIGSEVSTISGDGLTVVYQITTTDALDENKMCRMLA